MAWVKSHQSLLNHPKLIRLASITGLDLDVCGFKLHRLWWWALDYAENGDLSRFSMNEIGHAIGFSNPHEGQKFVQAIVDSGFIDINSMFIHDWLDYAGQYLHSKYHSSNPKRWKAILKKSKGQPKDGSKPDYSSKIVCLDKIKIDKKDLDKKELTPLTPPFGGESAGETFSPKSTEEGASTRNPPDELPREMLNSAERDPGPEESVSKTGQKPSKRTAQQAKTPKGERFMRFWRAYPRKQSKGRAERVWRRINPDEPLLAKMLTSIERAKTSEGWLKEHGRFIPHPATWLNAKGWEDEFPEGGENDNGGPGRKGFDLPSDYPNDLGE